MKSNKKQTAEIKQHEKESFASDEEVIKISKQLIKKNKNAYEMLAMSSDNNNQSIQPNF